jgi:fatty-acyl-CoA synthase
MIPGTGSWIRKWAEIRPNRTAWIFGEKSYSYLEANRRINQVASVLLEDGVVRGDRVAVLLYNGNEFLEVFFACAKIGAIFVPINFRLAPPEAAFILSDCGARILFYDPELSTVVAAMKAAVPGLHTIEVGHADAVRSVLQDQVGSSRISYGVSSYEALIASAPTDEPQAEVTLEDYQLIMYTSGTTGRPKGAVISHGNTYFNSVNGHLAYPILSTDVTYVVAPLFHMGALNIFTTPTIHAGGTVLLGRSFDPGVALETIERHRVTTMFGPPTMFQMMMEAPNWPQADLSSLRFLFAGGAPCPLNLIEAYNERGIALAQGFGLTETSPFVTLLPMEDAIRKLGSVGLPVFHSEVCVASDDGRHLEAGERGELLTRGPHIFQCYWNNPEATDAAFIDGWFRTGDIGYRDEEGYYYLVDRKKDMIISGGENIYPAELERVIEEHPAVLEVAVIGVPEKKWGEVPLAVVVRRSEADIDAEGIVEFLRPRLASYKLPRSVIFSHALPRSASGKVLKPVLREQFGGLFQGTSSDGELAAHPSLTNSQGPEGAI